MKADNVELGYTGEKAAAEILRQRGWTVEEGPPGGPDLIIEGCVTVDVKTARKTDRADDRYRRWQFCLWRDDGDHQPFNEDLLILICWGKKPTYFVIPGCLIFHRTKKIDITSANPGLYRGKYAEFREAWELADYVVAGTLWMLKDNLR